MEFEKIKQNILGKRYSLSIAYLSEKKSREINKKYRKINKPTNVLSFALSKNEGEIVLCKSVIRKELKKFDRNFEELLGFLVIHGMLHLKGMEHGSIMEKAEEKYDQKYFYRNRRRVHDNKSGRGRIFKGRKKS
jgi:probable rRNA maturation factor